MSEVVPDVDVSGFERHITALHAELRNRMAAYATRLQLEISRRVRAEIDERGPPIGERSSSSRVGSQSGALAAATLPGGPGNISERVITDDGFTITAGIDADLVPYATAQEYGATIEPRAAKALTIPTSAEAARALTAAGGDIRALDLVVIRTRSGGAALARKNGESIEVLFLLAKSVTLPPRPFWNPGIEEWIQSDLPAFTDTITADLAALWDAT
jgi:hypothetical protein